ncbi:hypothetical protein J2Y68_000656 [Paenarthrobacter nitroguajacolicus]|nr:hypothetical protein [Paenarthrobacter nitroguajacolicus]
MAAAAKHTIVQVSDVRETFGCTIEELQKIVPVPFARALSASER